MDGLKGLNSACIQILKKSAKGRVWLREYIQMANRRFTLPALKLTGRPASGGSTQGIVHRDTPKGQVDVGPASLPDPSFRMILGTQDCCSTSDKLMGLEPTGHELQSRSLITGWEGMK